MDSVSAAGTRSIFGRLAQLVRAPALHAGCRRSLPPEDRLRTRLADLVELRRAERFGIGPVVLRLSQEELARMVGVSRQTLNALLADLRAEGLVDVGFRSLRIPDPERLCAAAPPPLLGRRWGSK